MPDLGHDQRKQLEALRQTYQAELPDKVSSVARAAAAAGHRNWDPAGVRELHHLVHRLAGSSAIWGFTAVSRPAGELEEVVLAALEGTPPGPDLSGRVSRLVEELQQAIAPGPVPAPESPAAPRRGAS